MSDSIPEVNRLIIDSIPARIHTALPDGNIDFFNQTWLTYVGLSLEDLQGWKWTAAIHPADVEGIVERWRASLASGEPFLYEARVRRADGEYRWMLHHKVPLRDEHGKIVKWYGSSIDIEELRRTKSYLADGERLAHTGSWAFNPSGFFDYWSPELFRMYGLDPVERAPTLQEYLARVHPEDREFMAGTIQRIIADASGCDVKKRIVRPDGVIRYIRCVAVPVVDNGVLKHIVGTAMDVTEQEELAQELRSRGMYLAEAQKLSHTGSFGWKLSTAEISWSDETFRIFEYDRAKHRPTLESVLQRTYPEDRVLVQQLIDRVSADGTDWDLEHRLLMPDGSVKYVHVVGHARRDVSDKLEYVGSVMDITAAKEAEEKIRQNEREFRQIVEAIPAFIAVLSPDGRYLYVNELSLVYFGLTLQAVQGVDFSEKVFHPDDVEMFRHERQQGLLRGQSFEKEQRLRRYDGQYRWFWIHYNPVRDEKGRILRWYVTATDIDDRKRSEERTRNENIALREEIDKASMFEEIVGASEPLRKILSQVTKVAPTESTVLITGETGTGKELIARAIHKRSRRSTRAFVSVNCAAVPSSLIASELFGHEKGAFTGALERRLGRFELADGGTIFLDEIGDLPADSQHAMLRVLQEREIERVGGSRPIRVNVRVIAATNRDLESGVADGTFRADLFYRLNVFPLEVPALRERRTDVPMLVEYFTHRYAKRAGKRIRNISEETSTLLQSYDWPGNIRELQNVIERAVIVCDSDTLSIDERWLSGRPVKAPAVASPSTGTLTTHEKDVIEAALRESMGRVAGPFGAATRLGMPSSTLESKIKTLNIDKWRFKSP